MAKSKTPVKKDTEHELLAKELKTLIPKLDSEGLAFLIEQARVHLYNKQVEKLNDAAIAADNASARAKKLTKKPGGQSRAKGGKLKISGTDSGSSYYLYCPNDEVMFSKNEMIQLVKIANGKGSDLEIRERLYNWFERERRDVFAALPMADKFDNQLKALATVIKSSFKLRND